MTAPTRESVMELVGRLRDEANLCRNETADDVARLLDEAADALEAASENERRLLAQDVIHWKTRNSLLRERDAERLKRQQAEHERDSILEDLAGVQARLDTAEAELSVLKSGNVAR